MSIGTWEGKTGSRPYININGVCFVVVWTLDLKENNVASKNISQLSCLSLTSLARALRCEMKQDKPTI